MPGEQVALWLWDHIHNVWVKAPAVVSTVRVTGIEQAVARACKLYWIACSPDAPGSEFELQDGIGATPPEVYCHFDDDRHSEQLVLSPPMQFEKGIWVSKFDKMKCLYFGYV